MAVKITNFQKQVDSSKNKESHQIGFTILEEKDEEIDDEIL